MRLRFLQRRWRSLGWSAVIGLAAVPCWSADPLAGLLACRAVADASTRLACFDRESAALNREPGSAAQSANPTQSASPAHALSPPEAPPVRPPPPLDPQQQFGLPERKVVEKEVAAGTRAPDTSKVEAHITSMVQAADGRFVFTLDNAQVWRQLLPEGDLLAKPGSAVAISRGLLGSYWLQAGSGRGCKVTRLR